MHSIRQHGLGAQRDQDSEKMAPEHPKQETMERESEPVREAQDPQSGFEND